MFALMSSRVLLNCEVLRRVESHPMKYREDEMYEVFPSPRVMIAKSMSRFAADSPMLLVSESTRVCGCPVERLFLEYRDVCDMSPPGVDPLNMRYGGSLSTETEHAS
jgi:hypothetical protein